MLQGLKTTFSESGFMPHGHCYLWNGPLVWTHVLTDMLIGLAYISISLSLYALIKKIKLPFSTMVLSFGVFIGACGATHFMEVWNLWNADYWWAGLIKVLTAIASVATGIWLIKLKPAIVAFAEAAKMSAEHKRMLEIANIDLEARSIELARTNQILEEQQKVLAHTAKMSALGEMASGIAHEINSPLGIITLHANQLERFQSRGTLTPEQVTREAQLIATTAKRIGEIIKGLRSFAREGDKDPFLFAPVTSLVEDALVLCQSKFKVHGVELRIGHIPAGLEIECRAVQITQVILNLLTNGFDAVQKQAEKWVKLEVFEEAASVRIVVTDSGNGIPRDLSFKLFQPFFTTKEVGKGTGLGLSISRGIITSHKGVIDYDDSHERTRFVVSLPIRHESGTSA